LSLKPTTGKSNDWGYTWPKPFCSRKWISNSLFWNVLNYKIVIKKLCSTRSCVFRLFRWCGSSFTQLGFTRRISSCFSNRVLRWCFHQKDFQDHIEETKIWKINTATTTRHNMDREKQWCHPWVRPKPNKCNTEDLISWLQTQQRMAQLEGIKKLGILPRKGTYPMVQLVLRWRLGTLRRRRIRAKHFQGLKSDQNHKKEN
jgi:hypothetical protein